MFQDDAGLRKVFDLRSPHQMLEKLRWETAQINSMLAADDRKVIFAAFNAAATAWHLTEWITEIWDDLPPQAVAKRKYRDDVVRRCPDLEICRQISVGWKHRVVSQRNNPAVQASHFRSRQDDATPIALAGGVPLASTPLLDGWSARVTSGLGARLSGGAMLGVGAEYGGIGGNARIWTLTARARMPFD